MAAHKKNLRPRKVTFLQFLVYKSVMTNNSSISNFIFGASERELLTFSMAEIIDGLIADYKSFSHGNDEGILIPKALQEPRLAHSCILYSEGLRLAHTHLRLAKKLILASLLNGDIRASQWLKNNGEAKILETLLEMITQFEETKKKEREKQDEA